ncbi:hypothetical protein [Mumia sp. Pv 4-285]|uniref:hypothetical protein n=1 Tax=Mumia qirimensis TaxID=3234852 RepID=UPI00351DA5C1
MKLTRTAALVAGGVVLGLVAGGTATAVAVSSAKAVKVCVTKSGVVRAADARGKCPKATKKRAIAVRGPAGLRGAPGVRGPAGTAASVRAWSAPPASYVPVDGYDVAISSLTLPAGSYVVSASVDIENFGVPTGYMGGISVVSCAIPGYETSSFYLSPNGTYVSEPESLSLDSTVEHAGGPLVLRCSRVWNPARVKMAALTATKVGAIG